MEWVDVAVKIAFGVLSALVTVCIVPWLKEKRLYGIVKKAVNATEKWAENHEIDKKAFAISILKAGGVKVTPLVEAFIESAVEELDIALGKTNVDAKVGNNDDFGGTTD